MGSCCGVTSDAAEEDVPRMEAPPCGRRTSARSDDRAGLSEHNSQHCRASTTIKTKLETFTALGRIDSLGRRISGASRRSSGTADMMNGCTPTRTTTAALSLPGGISFTTTPTVMIDKNGKTVPVAVSAAATPVLTGPSGGSGGLRNDAGSGNAHEGDGDALLSDVFHISESSTSSTSSSSASLADRDALSTSLVEVSQATQSLRYHDRSHSEFDATSEWAEMSIDRTARRRSHSRLVDRDRNRLHHLLTSEAEARQSLTQMYSAQQRRMLLRCVKEQFIEQRVMMLRAYQEECTAMCAAWLVTRERAAREVIVRDWWTERATLAWRSSVTATAAAVVAADAWSNDISDAAKRDDSLMHVTSHTGREEELSSNEEDSAEEGSAAVRSPSVRLAEAAAVVTSPKAFFAPCAARLVLADATRSSISVGGGGTMSASSLPHSHGAVRKVSSAQQALRDRMSTRNRRSILPPSGSL